jgi:hypothetical protein
MDVNKLMYALDNETNENILHLTTKKIVEQNLNILKELHLERDVTLNYLKKLKGYKYVDELNELKYGSFIKWIPIIDPNYLPLHYCGIICEIKIIDDGVLITCKNFMHRHYTFKMDECLIFQKLSTQELIIINALDHLDNTPNETNNNTKKNKKNNEDSDSENEDSDTENNDSDNDDSDSDDSENDDSDSDDN